MIGTVTFYRMHGSLSSGEYPLLSSGQDLSSYQVATFANVKYRDGLQVSLEVPYFSGMETVNVAEIGGRYYWVTEYAERTAESRQFTLTLDYMGPTDLLRYRDEFSCDAKRTPYLTGPLYLRDEVSNGQMVVEDTIAFSELDITAKNDNFNGIGYWIQISGHDSTGHIKVFGGFIAYIPSQEQFAGVPIYAGRDSSDQLMPYVTYDQWLTDMERYTGFTDADIDDVSISKRCPFATITTTDSSTNNICVQLKTRNSTIPIPPTEISGYYFYNITDLWRPFMLEASSQTLTVQRSDDVRFYGTVGLFDWNRNEVMSLDGNRRLPITVTARMHSDISGIYCIIEYNNSIISIPEGKLPYFGNSYANYRSYSMEADRMAMQFAIQTADYNRETEIWSAVGNTVGSVANGAVMGSLGGNPLSVATGAIGGASSGIVSGYQSMRGYDLAVKTAQFNAEISKKRATSQPSSGYNVPYGSIYAYLNEHYPLCIMTKAPNCDALVMSSWHSQHGYPSEGVRTLRAQTGYYQGMVLADGSINAGAMYFDRLNEIFQNGFKFVSP